MRDQVTRINIPDAATDVVLFVHGFGVRWDSRDMFTDIRDSLPKSWGTALFDLYETEDDDVYITTVDHQVKRLRDIQRLVQKQLPDATIHLIAHSKGCIIASKALLDVAGQIILLAPPETIGRQLEDYLMQYPGAKRTDTELIIPRKDGTITHIPLDFFTQTAQLDPQTLIAEYAKIHPIQLIQTTRDEVIGETAYKKIENCNGVTITQMSSDHNFTGEHRTQLLATICQLLS